MPHAGAIFKAAVISRAAKLYHYRNLRVLRATLKGSFSRSAWLKRHLRFVAPRMWLCRELATRIDTVALARIANVRETRFGLEIELRGSGDLTALEVTLEPILPLSE